MSVDVLALSDSASAATSITVKMRGDPIEAADGMASRPIAGPRARAAAFTHLERNDIASAKGGTAYSRLDTGKQSAASVLSRSEGFGDDHVETRQGAVIEDASGISIHGSPSCSVALASTIAVIRTRPARNVPWRTSRS